MKKDVNCSVLVCVLAAAIFFCVLDTHEARCETDSLELQVLFIGDTKALLEPCG